MPGIPGMKLFRTSIFSSPTRQVTGTSSKKGFHGSHKSYATSSERNK